MSRWIDADAVIEKINTAFWSEIGKVIDDLPSIDIVRCKECNWLRYCETEDLDLYLDCDCPDGGGIPRNENWFCADGERRG